MSTTARLGIDIVGTDRTAAAFMSVERKIGGLSRAANSLKAAFAGGAVGGGIMLFVRKLIEVNRHVKTVDDSFIGASRAFQDFALKVGEGGLNRGLIAVNEALSRTFISGRSVAELLGGWLGAVLERVAIVLDVAARAVKFLSDNFTKLSDKLRDSSPLLFDFIGRLYEAANPLNRIDEAWKALSSSGAVDRVITTAKDLGIETDALTESSDELDKKVGKLSKTFDELANAQKRTKKESVDDSFKKQMELVDKWRKATLTPLEIYRSKLLEINVLHSKGLMGATTYARAIDLIQKEFLDAGKSMEVLNEKAKRLNERFEAVSETLASSFTDATMAVFDRTKSIKEAFSDMVDSILSDITRMALQDAFKSLLGGGSTGGGGGLFGNLLGGIGNLVGGIFGGGGSGGLYEAGTGRAAGLSETMRAPAARGNTIVIDQRRGGEAITPQRDGQGNTLLYIRDAVVRTIADGHTDAAMTSRFEIARRGRRL